MNSRNQIGTPQTTWILLAHRAGARILRSSGKAGDIRLVKELDYPEGRRQNHEIDTDEKGSRYSSTQMKHGLDPQLEAAEHVADVFAKSLAEELRKGRTHNEFEGLVLIAEPGFLGKVRGFLDKETEKRVLGSHNHNLSNLSEKELFEQIDRILFESRRAA